MIKVHTIPGGIHPETHKSMSNGSAAERIPTPDRLWIPVSAGLKYESEPIVNVGDSVKRFTQLTQPKHAFAVASHSPISGTVAAIEMRSVVAMPERQVLMIAIDNDGNNESERRAPMALDELSGAQILDRISRSGIQGQGGAGFSTQIKIAASKQVTHLIVNGVECEPYITADDRLMRDYSDDIMLGIQCIAKAMQLTQITLGTEDNKPQAFEAMQNAAAAANINMQWGVVPTKYPSGSEKQLIQLLTGQEVANGKLPADLGILMLNVGTLAAIGRAVVHDEPVTERLVTITGEACERPGNYWVPLGTPIDALQTFAKDGAKAQWIQGGPMMGVRVTDTTAPITQVTNCLLIQPAVKSTSEMPCIRCSACYEACPMQLLPQQLLWHAKSNNEQKLKAHNLFDCIECGACDYVCPSDIPLVQYYRAAKDELRAAESDRVRSEHARNRFEQRQARLERIEQEKIAKREARKKAAEAKKAAKQVDSDTTTSDKPKAGLLAAAMAKAETSKAPALSAEKLTKQVSNLEAQLIHQQQLLEEAGDDEKRAKIDARIKNTRIKIDQAKAKLASIDDQEQPNA